MFSAVSACENDFFLRPTITVARALLGALLVRDMPEGKLVGRIVETEAYLQHDPACHGVRETPGGGTVHRRTARNSSMFGPAGRAYVYFTYGNHFMLNVVTQPEGVPEAVLIRAIEPLEGLDNMARLRGKNDPFEFASGPGKLAKAFGINDSFDGHDLSQTPLRLVISEPLPDSQVVSASRVGISKAVDQPWRFLIYNSPWVSKKPR